MTSSSDGRTGLGQAQHQQAPLVGREHGAAANQAAPAAPAAVPVEASAVASAVASAAASAAAASAAAASAAAASAAAAPAVATAVAPAATAEAAPASALAMDAALADDPAATAAASAASAAAATSQDPPPANAAPHAQPSTPPPAGARAQSIDPATARQSTRLSLDTNMDADVTTPVPATALNTHPNAPASSRAQPHSQDQQTPRQQQQTQTAAAAPDQLPPSTPFATTPMGNLDQHAYVMMALASMSAGPSAMSPPPTVTPSQVTLPSLVDGLGPVASLRHAAAGKGLESFARIEFADSVFQMTTYAVIIGRDQRALEQARRDERRAEDHQRRIEENASKGLPPPSPIQNDRSKFSKSYVSEEGGMLGPESDSEDNGRPSKRRKTSTTGSSQNDDESQGNMISNRQYVSHTPGAAAVDLTSLRPSPYHVPFIGIHSPGPKIACKTKAISRQHLKIAYNQQDGVFEAIPLHKNGFFREDVHYKSEKVVLKCGDRLQIKDIGIRFIINGVERGRTGAEEFLEEEAAKKRHSHGGKEMSFDFEQSHGAGEVQDTSDELSDLEVSPPELSDVGEDADGGDVEEAQPEPQGNADGDVQMQEVKDEPVPDPGPVLPQIPKKRGPGRPPKNGIMSKREQRLLKKQQQEMAKKTIPPAPPAEPPIKRKVGRPRKHPLPENAEDRPEKRKYKPRKPKNEDGAEGSDAERRARERREKKARPKSPPLELKIEDYSEEQLQKPNKNYGVLIDETLTAAGPDGLTLKQIYKRICQRYPWFYFHTETKGWESSVRHNLIGNEAFKKDDTTNLWSRVPGVELDAGKKRKAPSPDRVLAAQGYGPYAYPYNTAQHMHMPGASGYLPGHSPPAGHPLAGLPGRAGQVPLSMQPSGNSASPTGQVGQPATSRPPAPPCVPGYGPPPAPAQAQPGLSQPGTYSSPYASRPPPVAQASVKTEDAAPAALPPPLPSVPHTAAPTSVSATVRPTPQAAPGQAGAGSTPGPIQTTRSAAAPASAAARPPAMPPKPVVDPRLLNAVVKLKDGLIENLKRAHSPNSEAIVMSALNRCIGLKKEATENDKMEAICIRGICQVIEGFKDGRSPTPGGAGAADATSLFLEPRVLVSLNGFKDVSIRALKARLGESKAEAVTLSALDRVLGLADASIVPPSEDGEQGGNFEGVEQHLIKSIRQLLVGMNQKLLDHKA